MSDIHIKASDALRQYANKLVSFRDGVIMTGTIIYFQSKKLEKNLERQLHQIRYHSDSAKENANRLIKRYKDAIDVCSNARPIIGESDNEVRELYRSLENDVNEYRKTIVQMQVILAQVRERTKNFGVILNEMTNHSTTLLREKATKVDEYNQIKTH